MYVTPLTAKLAAPTNEHLTRHIHESGRHGVHWLPYSPGSLPEAPTVDEAALQRAYHQVSWERWQVVVDSSEQVVGHLSLKGGRFDRGIHRCELGMGLEFGYWRLGLGSQLLKLAIEQAQSVATLDWLDLRVIHINQPAINLYLKHGFAELSRIPDFCRIDAQPVDDIFMSMWVGNPRSSD